MHVQNAPDHAVFLTITRGICVETTQLCQALIALGMAFPGIVPDFPNSDHLDSSDYRGEQPVTDRARRYEHALERVRVDHGTSGTCRTPGIPVHKLTSGDHWHVTATECAEALTAYDIAITAGASHPDAFADDVLPFLRTAARHGGFRVT